MSSSEGDVVPRPDFSTAVPADLLGTIQHGVLRTRYRGIPFFKSPFDVVLYLQLLDRLRPATIIEIGTYQGGSALWFADMMSARGTSTRIISVDIDSKPDVTDDRITFLPGNANDLSKTLPTDLLSRLAHPWLVIEDSAHLYEPCLAVLRFFHSYLQSGDYFVMEDGVVSRLPDQRYRAYEDGPNRAVADFLAEHGAEYEIDAVLCDFFGRNVTYNPSGWLARR
jgi:cephalosporin hydroxylase